MMWVSEREKYKNFIPTGSRINLSKNLELLWYFLQLTVALPDGNPSKTTQKPGECWIISFLV